MKQPESLEVGTYMDVVRYRLNVAKEDLCAAKLTFEAEQYRAANHHRMFHYAKNNINIREEKAYRYLAITKGDIPTKCENISFLTFPARIELTTDA